MEYKYIINVIFHQPVFNEETGSMQLVSKNSSLGYENEEEAIEAYEKFNEQAMIEFETPTGKVSFNILMTEFVDVAKHEELMEQQQETESDELLTLVEPPEFDEDLPRLDGVGDSAKA